MKFFGDLIQFVVVDPLRFLSVLVQVESPLIELEIGEIINVT
jgi:hypothetical protein